MPFVEKKAAFAGKIKIFLDKHLGLIYPSTVFAYLSSKSLFSNSLYE